jgi:hypothetical protein
MQHHHQIIIIIIRHELGLERPVSSSSLSLFKGLPSRLRPCGLQFNIIFGILLLCILVACCSQFNSYLLSFSSTSSTFSPSKISSFLLWSKWVYPAVFSENFHLDVNRFLSLRLKVQISLPYKTMWRASALYIVIIKNFCNKVGSKELFRIPSI